MSLPSRRRLRAPQEDGAALIDPPLAEVPALITANQAIGHAFDQQAGFPAGYRTRARQGLLLLTSAQASRQPANLDAGSPVILSGHQPELFHPGVWFKNFVLSSVARHVSGVGINLLVDNDTVKSTSIRVPTRVDGPPRVVEVPFDASASEAVWESRQILDPAMFESFTRAVAAVFLPDQGGPAYRQEMLLHRLWPQAVAAARQTRDVVAEATRMMERYGLSERQTAPSKFAAPLLGESLAAGRHQFERELGLETREYPLGRLANAGGDLLTFIVLLFERHHEFHQIHNSVLAEYRLAEGIRGTGRPVADLTERDGWMESPLWNLSFQSGARRRVYVRELRQGWEVTDGAGAMFASSAGSGSEALGIRLIKAGFRLRPRALITTMYARLVLSDLFIHGIGGAKYDEVTDEIIRRFFGIEPPKYVTATATFRLPIDQPQVTIEGVRENVERLREVRYRPESFVNDPLLASEPEMQRQLTALAAEKKEYVAKHALRRGSEQVFRGLDKLNRAMYELLAPVEQHLQRERARLAEELRIAGLLGSREFSFVLYPEEYLVPRLLELSRLPA